MARKSKKVDFVNVNDLPQASRLPALAKAVCYNLTFTVSAGKSIL